LAAVGEALRVGVADAGHAELVELVVPAHTGEGDAVIDLVDLVQRARGVLGGDEDALGEHRGDERPSARDPLAGVVGAVLHDLLWGHVEGHRHGRWPSARLRSMRTPNRSPTSGSLASSKPSAVTVATIG